MSDVDSPTVDTANAAGAQPAAQQQQVAAAIPTPGSLEQRVAERREKLEQKTTELFDVPGYEGVFQVELRLLGGKRQFGIVEALERVHDDYRKALSAATDMILASTVGIHAIVDDEGTTALAEGMTWLRLAQAADKKLGPEVKSRAALIRLLGENGVLDLAGEWRMWMRNRGTKVDRDLERDF